MEKKEHKGGIPLEVRKARFISRAVALWGDVNDYSLLQYTKGKEPCVIHCRQHGPYRVPMAQNHIMKNPQLRTGCPWCKEEQTGQHNRRLFEERREKEQAKQAERERKQREKAQAEERHRLEIMQCVSSHGYDVDSMTWKQIAQRYGSIKSLESDYMQQASRRKVEREAEEKRLRAEREAERIRQRTIELIENAKAVHGDRYNYSQAYYEVREHRGKRYGFLCNIICKDHGPFDARADVHISQGCQCPKCVGYQNLLTPEQHLANYIKRAYDAFGTERFDYSAVRYINKRTPVWIRCNEHNRWFKMRMEDHVRKSGGCPDCVQSRGECLVRHYLEEHNIGFLQQYRIDHDNIFCKRDYLIADFYIPQLHTIIEYNGKQHYEYVKHFHTKQWTLEDQQERDETLRLHCKRNKLHLIEIPYWEEDNISAILEERLRR